MFGETKPSFFKRKGMPTPDASQFTQLKKYSAVAGIGAQGQGQKRTVTRTTQPLPSVLRPLNFLPSFSNKVTSGTSFVPINRVTGLQAKTKVPGGHVFGDSSGPNPSGYDETIVNNSSFTNKEVIFNKSITTNSPFRYNLYERFQRYGHYFNLNGLSSDYIYTFEISDDSINTIIALFNTQDKALINNNENGILEDNDAGVGAGDESNKLSDKIITDNWCLVVSSYNEQLTGTFTLKITRTPPA